MNVGRWAIVIIGCMLFFGIGFKAGEFVEAGGITPGSVGDPLAAKSYVDKAVGEKITELQAQAESLAAKVKDLQDTVDKLQSKVGVQTNVSGSEPAPQSAPTKSVENTEENVSPTGQTAYVKASANVRKGPGTNYEIVSGLSNGKSVPVLKIEGDWVYVDLGDKKGWINRNLVEIK